MTNGKEKILWMVYAGILIVLFLLSSTDLIIKEQKTEVYSVSVIVEDARDDHYVNFRKGMEQAAIEMNADVNFITLYDAGDSSQQMDLILREQQDGVQAQIIAPVYEAELLSAIQNKEVNGPIVLLNSELTGDKIAAAISPDYYAMGQKLGKVVLKEQAPGLPIYLFAKNQPEGMAARFYEGIVSILEPAGYLPQLLIKQEPNYFRSQIEALVYPGCQHAVIIAIDQESLIETAAVLTDSIVYNSYIDGLYGRGSNLTILNNIDKGIISGVCVIDDYSVGYLSVKAAIEAIANKNYQGAVVMESFYVTKKDLRKPEFEKMLYPIE